MLKKVLKIIKYLTLLGVLLFIGFYFYVKYYWHNFIDEDIIELFTTEVKLADKLPKKFYELYNVEYNNALLNNFNNYALKEILYTQYREKPPSAQVARMFIVFSSKTPSRHRYKLLEISLTWEIEKRTSQQECLNWITEKYDFLNQAKGIKQASKLYFKKTVENLNEKELAQIVIMLKNSSLYNPFRRQKLIDVKVQELLSKRQKLTTYEH